MNENKKKNLLWIKIFTCIKLSNQLQVLVEMEVLPMSETSFFDIPCTLETDFSDDAYPNFYAGFGQRAVMNLGMYVQNIYLTNVFIHLFCLLLRWTAA